MSEALDATGRNMLYSLCEWGVYNPAAWASEIANSWRVSGDIRDSWDSIVTRIAIDAPLWRYAGSGGWNDPDMLEVGNGQCSESEYRYHFSMWAMLKAPLLIGNDLRGLVNGGDETKAIRDILTNAEVIAINQDALGRQARRVWSDGVLTREKVTEGGDSLIAAKCATGKKGAYEDAMADQQWEIQTDGTIKSASTGMCLQEMRINASSTVVTTFPTVPYDNLYYDQRALDVFELSSVSVAYAKQGAGNDEEVISAVHGVFGLTTAPCTSATKWATGQYDGAAVVSQTTGRCLEVSTSEKSVLSLGKRIQTGICRGSQPVQTSHDLAAAGTEHQSWTAPTGKLMNLFQRQCLTVDRDAPQGQLKEVWVSPLADGSVAVALANKGPVEGKPWQKCRQTDIKM
jgi:hypothetical protein